jgi:hypothetical protein
MSPPRRGADVKLSLLLFVLARKLRRALKTRAAFRSHVGNLKVRILVRTADGRHGRVFAFDRGRLSTRRGASHAADAALVWSDPATAYRVMTSGREEESFRAAAEGKLRIDGMPGWVQWFTDGVKLAI